MAEYNSVVNSSLIYEIGVVEKRIYGISCLYPVTCLCKDKANGDTRMFVETLLLNFMHHT